MLWQAQLKQSKRKGAFQEWKPARFLFIDTMLPMRQLLHKLDELIQCCVAFKQERWYQMQELY